MDKGEKKKGFVEVPVPIWDEWYNKTREQVTKDIAQLELISQRPRELTHPSWVLPSYQYIRALMDIAYQQHQAIAKLQNDISKIAEILKRLSEYEPTLKHIKRYIDEQGEIGKWK